MRKIFVIFIFLICSCQEESINESLNQIENRQNLDSLENIVLNSLIDQVVDLETKKRIFIKLENESQKSFDSRVADSNRKSEEFISANGYSVFIHDSLFRFPDKYLSLIDSNLAIGHLEVAKYLSSAEGKILPKNLNVEKKFQLLDKKPPVDNQLIGYRGFARFYRIGFNKSRTTAITYYSYDPSGSGLGGNGWLVILKKKSDKWEIESKLELWTS